MLDILLALTLITKRNKQDGGFLFIMKPPDTQAKTAASESRMTLEMIISVGVLGWLAMGMVLMGLGIW